MSVTLAQIIEATSGALLHGGENRALPLRELKEPAEAGPAAATFLITAGFMDDVAKTRASVIVVQDSLWDKLKDRVPSTVKAVVGAKDAYLGLARVSGLFAKAMAHGDWLPESVGAGAVHPSARVDASARVCFGALVCADAVIGPRSVILPGAVVGPGCQVGADCTLFPGAMLYPRTVLGDRVRIHANAVLGADGFGYAKGPRGSEKIWHLGRVVVGNDVEIGAGACVDRGTLRDSIVEDGAKIDNLVQVGHNGHIKAHAILCAQVGLAGNGTVGRGAILAGQVGVADKIKIGDGSVMGPQAGISKDVPAGEIMMGIFPARPRREWWKFVAQLDRLAARSGKDKAGAS